MGYKKIIRRALSSPLGAPLRRIFGGRGVILTYHRITSERFNDSEFNPEIGLAVNVDEFDKQLAYLSDNFYPTTLTNLGRMLRGEINFPEKPVVVVTFDDGYLDNLTLALPILAKWNVPATIFVTSGFIDRTHEPWWLHTGRIVAQLSTINFEWEGREYLYELKTKDEKFAAFFEIDLLMKSLSSHAQMELLNTLYVSTDLTRYSFDTEFLDWDHVRELDSHQLISIGAHTVSHAVLSICSKQELDFEIQQSKGRIESELDHGVATFALPYGGRDHGSLREFRAMKSSGFDLCVTTRPGHIHSRHVDFLHCLPRMVVDHYVSIDDFEELILTGIAAMLKGRGQIVVTD